jgi:preprotein translocase subunit SecD
LSYANNDVIQARVIENRGTFDVDLMFSPEGAARMQVATSSHYGKPLAIIVNGELLAAPEVRETISSHLLISAGFTRNEANRIASGLQR